MTCFAKCPEIGCKDVSACSAVLRMDGISYTHHGKTIFTNVLWWWCWSFLIHVQYCDAQWVLYFCVFLISFCPDSLWSPRKCIKWTILSQMSEDDSALSPQWSIPRCHVAFNMYRKGQHSSATGPAGRRDGATWLGESHTAATAGPCGFPSGGIHLYPIASSGALADGRLRPIFVSLYCEPKKSISPDMTW